MGYPYNGECAYIDVIFGRQTVKNLVEIHSKDSCERVSQKSGQFFGQPINRRTSNDNKSFLPPRTMALAGPVASLLSSGPIVTTPGSTEIKPYLAAIKKPNTLPDCIAPSSEFGLYTTSATNVLSSSATAGFTRP
jgi:hypothetical protein